MPGLEGALPEGIGDRLFHMRFFPIFGIGGAPRLP